MALFDQADDLLHTSNRSERDSVQFGDSNLLDDHDLEDFSNDKYALQYIQTPLDSKSSRHATPQKVESQF